MLAAGKLDRRITLQRPVETRGASYGDVQKTWVDVATVWAAYEPLSGRELLLTRQVTSEMTVRFRIRHLAGINAKMRVLLGVRVFQILSPPIEIGGRGVEMHLECAERIVG